MSRDKMKNRISVEKLNKWAGVISILSLVISAVLGIAIYLQNEKINSLSKGQLANEILISSLQMDTINKVSDILNISIDITSNYDGAMPIYIKLVEVRLDGERILSDYKHSWLSKQEYIIEKDGKVSFKSTFEANKKGEYELDYIVYYNYPQEESYSKGKPKPYTLKFILQI